MRSLPRLRERPASRSALRPDAARRAIELAAEEAERRRLAADLHDGPAQALALAHLKLQELRATLDAALRPPLDAILELVRQASGSTRALAFELDPPVLHARGVLPAVERLVESLGARYGLRIDLDSAAQEAAGAGRGEREEDLRTALYRSTRELLINAARHAGARRVGVRVREGPDGYAIDVEDDGVGMRADAADGGSLGLAGVRRRLARVGGSLAIDSAPGRGSRLHVSAPRAPRLP